MNFIIEPVAGFTLGLILLFVILCFMPFHIFYLRARFDLLIVLCHIVASPLGIVRFKHFFLADIITSFVNPLKDVGSISCYFIRGLWLTSQNTDNDHCPMLQNYQLAIAFLPYWFRLAQCLRRYHETQLKAHLVNGGKYFSSLCIQFAAIFKTLYPESD